MSNDGKPHFYSSWYTVMYFTSLPYIQALVMFSEDDSIRPIGHSCRFTTRNLLLTHSDMPFIAIQSPNELFFRELLALPVQRENFWELNEIQMQSVRVQCSFGNPR